MSWGRGRGHEEPGRCCLARDRKRRRGARTEAIAIRLGPAGLQPSMVNEGGGEKRGVRSERSQGEHATLRVWGKLSQKSCEDPAATYPLPLPALLPSTHCTAYSSICFMRTGLTSDVERNLSSRFARRILPFIHTGTHAYVGPTSRTWLVCVLAQLVYLCRMSDISTENHTNKHPQTSSITLTCPARRLSRPGLAALVVILDDKCTDP